MVASDIADAGYISDCWDDTPLKGSEILLKHQNTFQEPDTQDGHYNQCNMSDTEQQIAVKKRCL